MLSRNKSSYHEAALFWAAPIFFLNPPEISGTEVVWTSPIAFIGGFALLMLAFIQYWFDRKKVPIEESSRH
ncbi:MAG: hypothetical protein ACTSU3_03360 [Candidatus Thorarchaeota archaeon]